jgi:hypothetical protein
LTTPDSQTYLDAGDDLAFIGKIANDGAAVVNPGHPNGTATNRTGGTSKNIAKIVADAQAGVDISTALAVSASAAAIAAATTATGAVSGFSVIRRAYLLKTFKPKTGGTAATADTTWIMNSTVVRDGAVTEIECWASGAGPAKIKFYTIVGNVKTLVGTISFTLASGYNYLKAALGDFAALNVTAGWYCSFYSLAGIITQEQTAQNSSFIAKGGDVGSFTDGTVFGSGITPALRISIDSNVLVDFRTTPRSGGRFPAQVMGIIAAGQSVSAGAAPAVTVASLYDNAGLLYNSDATTAIDFLPLTALNCANNKESPILDAASAIKELILTENALTWQQNDFQILASSAALTTTTLAQSSYGSTLFNQAMGQITAGLALSTKQLKTYFFAATFIKQGEANNSDSVAAYKTPFKQLANDYDTYGRAAAGGQTFRPLFITYQTNSDTFWNVAQAQHEAALEHPRIRLSSPSYPCVFQDSLHPNGDSSQWLGDFDGLVVKREVVDQQHWEHLYIHGATVSGATITLSYGDTSALVFDTTALPAQTNMGYTAKDAGGVTVAVTGVTILDRNRVRLTFASSAAAASVATVGYGQAAMTGRGDAYTGGGGNLRDSLGDAVFLRGRRMDRWAVLQRYSI